MPDDHVAFGSLTAANAGLIVDREAQSVGKVKLPQNLTIVSADNHIEITEDIFHKEFPARLRDKRDRQGKPSETDGLICRGGDNATRKPISRGGNEASHRHVG